VATLVRALALTATAIITVFCLRLLWCHIMVHMLRIHRHGMLGGRCGIGHAITGLPGKRQRLAKINQ
jgi:hypothetical protein